ncbi:MAG: sigma 54-interacting transcriptional regulator [bacterium]
MALILVIDDEHTIRHSLQLTLERSGHSVRAAGSVDEGIELVRSQPWDIALVDLVLGNASGIDVLRAARESTVDCPVLMITGHPSLDTAEDALRLGAYDYIKKPFRPRELLEVVNRALEQRHLLLERRRLERENIQVRERIEAVFNSVLDGILTVDRNGTVQSLNSAAASLFRVSQDEAIGTSLRVLCGEERGAMANAVEQSLRTGEFIQEYQITDRSDAHLWTYILTITPMQAVIDDHAVVVIRDVSRLRQLEREVSQRFSFENMIGKSPAMQKVFEMIRDLSDTDTTVLIQGASGTGKELVGAALHYHGARSAGPLIKVNCAALPETLLESELFGHVRGAFTGATKDKIGRFELANSGTIFLDEIGDISHHLQQRLLRVLQEREIERVGSTRVTKIDVRVVAATNRDLSQLVEQGKFREDLFYRLNVVAINIPPLRDRREDIPPLIEHFLQRFQVHRERIINGIEPAAMEVLLHYGWPGNVRQLENALEHAVVLSRDGFIRCENLPPEIAKPPEKEAPPMPSTLEQLDAQRLQEALDSVGWNRSRAARRLGVDRTTVWRKIKEYGLEPPDD